MSAISSDFDPWGPISSILYEINDSDFVQNAIANTGIDIAWRPLSNTDAYSHGTRIRAVRQDISGAYAKLPYDKRGLFAYIVVRAMLNRHDADEVRTKLIDRLSDIGWTIADGDRLTTLNALVSEQFFPHNSEYDAFVAIRDLFFGATSKIVIVDSYINSSLLITLRSLQTTGMLINILTVEKNLKPDFSLELTKFKNQINHIEIEVRTTSKFHDRFIVIDDAAYFHVGASTKDTGNRAFMISRIEDQPNIENASVAIAEAWAIGLPYQP